MKQKKELEASGFFCHLIEENKKLCSCIENIAYCMVNQSNNTRSKLTVVRERIYKKHSYSINRFVSRATLGET